MVITVQSPRVFALNQCDSANPALMTLLNATGFMYLMPTGCSAFATTLTQQVSFARTSDAQNFVNIFAVSSNS